MIPTQGQAFAFRGNGPAGEAVFQGQFTAGIQRNIPIAGIEIAQIDAHPFLAGDQANTVGIHPAQRAGIHRHFRGITFAGKRADTAISRHPVSPRHHRQ
ncbi:hypothetical protein D3C76_1435020 [compost metagenome]